MGDEEQEERGGGGPAAATGRGAPELGGAEEGFQRRHGPVPVARSGRRTRYARRRAVGGVVQERPARPVLLNSGVSLVPW